MGKILIGLFCLSSLYAGAQKFTDSLYITTSDSVKLFVKRSGSGFPVLFIHGGPGSNSYYFEKEGGDVFSSVVQLVYLDQRGCGRSDTAKNNDYSLERVVKDFEEVRQSLHIRQWMVMAHSFGGILATEYAYRYPDGVKAMVYLNCTISLPNSAQAVINKTIETLKLQGKEKEELLNDSVPIVTRWMEAFSKLHDKDLSYILMFDNPKSKTIDDDLMREPFLKFVYSRKLWAYPEYLADFSPKTSQINMPVLIISGTRDYAIGLDHPAIMHFPKMELKHVQGGHALYLEHNKELFEAVAPFLKKYGK